MQRRSSSVGRRARCTHSTRNGGALACRQHTRDVHWHPLQPPPSHPRLHALMMRQELFPPALVQTPAGMSACRRLSQLVGTVVRQRGRVLAPVGSLAATRRLCFLAVAPSCHPIVRAALRAPCGRRGVAVEAGQLRKGDFFDFKGKRCVVLKASQQINNRKAFAIVEFRDVGKPCRGCQLACDK